MTLQKPTDTTYNFETRMLLIINIYILFKYIYSAIFLDFICRVLSGLVGSCSIGRHKPYNVGSLSYTSSIVIILIISIILYFVVLVGSVGSKNEGLNFHL